MIQSNYIYGQGIINSNLKLFFTPKKLSPADYTIDVSLDIENNTYTGVETIVWQNESQLPINRFCIDRGIIATNDLTIEEINGTPPDERQLLFHNRLILIDLPAPIVCGGQFTIKAKFSAQLPKSDYHEGDIFEFDSEIAWYPKLYWDEPTGNTYKVTFGNVTDGYQVFAAGEKTGNTYSEYNIANYYGFAVSKIMTSISAEVRGIAVTIVHYPKYREFAEFMLETATDALDFFIDFIGFYPYKSFTVIPGSQKWYGGYIFSGGIVYVHNFESYDPNNQKFMDYFKAIVPHEIGHQYFWEYVIENESPGWLGLGLSMALDREYSQHKAGAKSFYKSLIDDYLEYVDTGKNTTITLSEEDARRALNDEDNEYGSDYNSHIRHGKSFSIMSMLIDIIGKDRFFNIMRHILNTHGGKPLYTPDFINICEEFSGISLNWFFVQWLKSNKSMSCSMGNITERGTDGAYTVTVDVCRNDSIAAPVCVAAYFEDGSSQTIFTERLLSKQKLIFTAKSKCTKIIFNPFETYAMAKSHA